MSSLPWGRLMWTGNGKIISETTGKHGCSIPGVAARRLLAAMALCVLVGCATIYDPVKPGTSIAVWDLENVTVQQDTLPNLGEMLSAKVIETLKSHHYLVVEREKLLLALEELGLGTTALVDESTRLTIGNMIGAKLMVFGGYQVVGGLMRMDLRIIDVETGSVVKAGEKTVSAGDLSGWIDAAENVTLELIGTGQ